MLSRSFVTVPIFLAVLAWSPSSASAQIPSDVRTVNRTPVLSRPTDDATVVVTVEADTLLKVLDADEQWLWVSLPSGAGGARSRGWVRAANVQVVAADGVNAGSTDIGPQRPSVLIPPAGDAVRRAQARREQQARDQAQAESRIERARQRLERERQAYEAVVHGGDAATLDAETRPHSDADPLIGTWRFVPERSRFDRFAPKDIRLKFAAENGVLREEEETVLPDGTSRLVVFVHQYDGHEHGVEMADEMRHRTHTVVWTRIDDQTVERRINHDNGQQYTTDRLVLSPDRKALTETHLGKRTDGTAYEEIETFIKQ